MISNDTIMVDLIAFLKAAADLTDWLDDHASEAAQIKEAAYQGVDKIYPGVRVGSLRQIPITSARQCDLARLTGSMRCFAESASSREANQLAGVVNDVIHRQQLTGTGYIIPVMRNAQLVQAVPTAERLWVAEVAFTGNIYPAS